MSESASFQDMTSAELDASFDKMVAGAKMTPVERAAATFRLNQFPSDPAYESGLLLGEEGENL
jgi:hypothetical protein